ncbi:MAG: type II toxin-antitoxin system VapC family toxin [Promicromonosporaceae bacterium]|nr:type II toxin-antitoxin system VapC family toxin [Promicromonosporaceae bacterium]
MTVVADTNVLLRLLLADDPHQGAVATRELTAAAVVILPIVALCELSWVLRQGLRYSVAEVADAIDRLVSAPNAQFDERLVDAGLAVLRAGGDFADGVIANTGPPEAKYLTFDKQAARLVGKAGVRVRLLK